MADLTNLKLQIVAAIRANGQGAITGPLLQEQLLDMVDAMEVDTWGGFITAETVAPSDITHAHLFLAVTAGTYEAFDLTVEEGDIWVVAREADGTEWSKTNLAAGLKELIRGLQDALTPGNGIDIDNEGNIRVKLGEGMTFDDNGNVKPDSTIATVQGVENYVTNQKGVSGGIAPLNENGEVDKNDLPEDTVYFEAQTDPATLIDEYNRLLARLYAAVGVVDDIELGYQRAIATVRTAIMEANDARDAAQTAARNASASADDAGNAAADARTATHNAESATEQLELVIAQTNEAARQATEKGNIAQSAAGEVSDKGAYAKREGDNAAEKAALADEKAEYAQQQGDYAKAQGEAAQDIVEGSKGDYDSLNERLAAVDTELAGDITYVDNNDPTSLI